MLRVGIKIPALSFCWPSVFGGNCVGLCRVSRGERWIFSLFAFPPAPKPYTPYTTIHFLNPHSHGVCVYLCRDVGYSHKPLQGKITPFLGEVSGKAYIPAQPYTTSWSFQLFPPLGMRMPSPLEGLPRRRLFPFSSLLPSHRRENGGEAPPAWAARYFLGRTPVAALSRRIRPGGLWGFICL